MNDSENRYEERPPGGTLKPGRRTRLIILICVCCIGFFIVDVVTPNCFEDPFPGLLSLGVVTAQLTIICVWGTLVRGTFWIRIPWTLLLLVISWYGFALGIMLEAGKPDANDMLTTAVVWTFGFVTSFVPLKIAAMCFRWQIVQDSEQDSNAGQKPRYAIRDIMIGTCLLAISMGIARAMLPVDDMSIRRILSGSLLGRTEFWISTTIFGIVSLLVKLPCIWISLGAKASKIKKMIGLWLVYCLVLASVEFVLLIALMGAPGPQGAEILAGIIISHQVMGGIMLALCLALRGLGYRLDRSTDRKLKHEIGKVSLVTTSIDEAESA